MRISIFAKLALTFLVTVVGLVAFIAVGSARELDQSFTELVKDREETVASGIGLEVDLLLQGVESRLKGMASNQDFRISLVDRLAGTSPEGELIDRVSELRNIADLDYLWLISPDGILLATGHDPNVFNNNMLEPSGTYSEKLASALHGEIVRAIGVETIFARSTFVAEVFLPVTMSDRFLGSEQIDGILWGAEVIDADFIKRSADLADAKIVVVTNDPDVEPIVSWLDPGQSIDPNLLSELTPDQSEINLDGEIYHLATIPFPRSDTMGDTTTVTLHLLIPKSDLIAQRVALLRGILLQTIIGGIIAILLAFLIAKSITLPIERLKTAVTALASGDLSRRVDVHSRDEVEDLVKSFNTMADELDANTRRLVEAEKLSAWREVARRLAHEIKNPLSPIKLSIQNLMRVYHGHPETFEKNLVDTSETILEEVDRLKTLADEFSNFARMPKPILVPSDICEILRSSVALFDKPEIGAAIVLDCQNNIPNSMLDRDAMSRVFTNLIKNAVEAMEGRQGKIRVGARHVMVGATPVVRITIADEGIGMDENALKQSFNPYFTTKRGGSGLGLAIVQSIVSEHRGRIYIESEPGKGTTVIVDIPAIPGSTSGKRRSPLKRPK
jgi:two-component system nitrogen regulation sensor histidine kinase NtrY